MKINQKDVVLLPYPFSNLEERKVRPAIIISNEYFNRSSKDIIAIPMTSVLKEEQFSILIEQRDFSNGKLIKPSRIRFDKIFSVEKRLIQMKIGTVNDLYFQKLRKEFFNLIN